MLEAQLVELRGDDVARKRCRKNEDQEDEDHQQHSQGADQPQPQLAPREAPEQACRGLGCRCFSGFWRLRGILILAFGHFLPRLPDPIIYSVFRPRPFLGADLVGPAAPAGLTGRTAGGRLKGAPGLGSWPGPKHHRKTTEKRKGDP